MNRNSNGSVNRNGSSGGTKEKALRSKRFYWAAGTIIIAAVLVTLYYSTYVSSQRAYYNERAFRLLSSMADKFSSRVRIAENVLKASASYLDSQKASNYIQRVLHGEMDEHDFTIIDWHKANATATPTRDGTITWFMPESPNDSRIRVDYREGQPASQARQGQKEGETPPERPCAGELPYIAVCASVDLDPLVRPSFRDLEEGFFDDVLIADMEGSVLYQESRQGIRIQNIGAALLLSNTAASSSFFSRAQPSSPSVSTAPRPFATLSQSSARTTIELAGSDYELFVEPLRISLTQQQQHRRLVLCGLRTSKHSHAQTLVVPYAYLAWSILILGAVFALGWPLLKFTYMSAKERLQTRHILYLLASILLATALVTLIALNALYVQAFDKDSRAELKHLAEQINTNFTAELSSAISALDALAIDPTLVKEGNQANFLHEHRDL